MIVKISCDTAALAHSPELPKSIYDPGEELFGLKERDALVSTLLDQGADKLLAVLQDTPKVGFIRSSTGGLGWDLHYARKTMLPDGGEQVILATDRPLGFWEESRRLRTVD